MRVSVTLEDDGRHGALQLFRALGWARQGPRHTGAPALLPPCHLPAREGKRRRDRGRSAVAGEEGKHHPQPGGRPFPARTWKRAGCWWCQLRRGWWRTAHGGRQERGSRRASAAMGAVLAKSLPSVSSLATSTISSCWPRWSRP
uniref:Uncharacterized protein n=1 Tax=Arundo donax TaxID=35708 RepID=A0A0A9DZ63_ARUDO